MNSKQQLIQYYQWLRQYGYNDSHSGNASIRNGDSFWVTPSGACGDTLKDDDLVACNIDGSLGEKASLDGPLHLAVYQKNPQACAILHSHGAYSVAVTLNGNDFMPGRF